MKRSWELLIGTLRFWVFAIASGMFMVLAYALSTGSYIGEPNRNLGTIEAVIFLVLAGFSLIFAYLETRRKL